jgi:hypothetical protein
MTNTRYLQFRDGLGHLSQQRKWNALGWGHVVAGQGHGSMLDVLVQQHLQHLLPASRQHGTSLRPRPSVRKHEMACIKFRIYASRIIN